MSKISIVMPVYNTEKYLEKCLDSIFSQTFQDFELICINDGSTDNSLNILNKYQKIYPHLLKIVNQKNQGAGAARNAGFEHVKSETTIFLDSDDYFYPEFLEKLYKQYKKTNADIVICQYNVVSPDGSLHSKENGLNFAIIPDKEIFNKYDFPKYFFNFVNHASWNKLIKTELIRENDLKFHNIPNSNDVLFTLSSLFSATSITIVKDILMNYNFLRENSTTINRKNTNSTYIFETFERLKKFIIKKAGADNNFMSSYFSACFGSMIYTFCCLPHKHRYEFLKLIKQNMPMLKMHEMHRKDLYYKLWIIKKFPPIIFIFFMKIIWTLKRIKNTTKKLLKS